MKKKECTFPVVKKMWLLPDSVMDENGVPVLEKIQQAVKEGKAIEVKLTRKKQKSYDITMGGGDDKEVCNFFEKVFQQPNVQILCGKCYGSGTIFVNNKRGGTNVPCDKCKGTGSGS